MTIILQGIEQTLSLLIRQVFNVVHSYELCGIQRNRTSKCRTLVPTIPKIGLIYVIPNAENATPVQASSRIIRSQMLSEHLAHLIGVSTGNVTQCVIQSDLHLLLSPCSCHALTYKLAYFLFMLLVNERALILLIRQLEECNDSVPRCCRGRHTSQGTLDPYPMETVT